MFKKAVVTLTLLSVLAAPIAVPKRAEALVGAGMLVFGGAGVPLLVIGGASITVGAGSVLSAGRGHCDDTCSIGRVIFGVLGILAGVVLLDGEAGQDLAFAAVEGDAVEKIGLTADETLAFNSELAEINAIRETIQGDLLSKVAQGEKVNAQVAHAQWESFQEQISPEAFSALKKVSAHFTQVIAEQAR